MSLDRIRTPRLFAHASGSVATLALLGLVACGGKSSSSASSIASATGTGYSVEGTITGLAGAGLLIGNGKDTVTEASGASSFTFPTLVADGATYDVTIVQQPSGQACTVAYGTGTMGTSAVTNVQVTCGGWDWLLGSDTPGAVGVYGTLGFPGSAASPPITVPGARAQMVTWTDSSHNFWLFGGSGYDAAGDVGDLNDLWEYNFDAQVWTWVSGADSVNALGVYGAQNTPASTNTPGARFGAASWTDSQNNLWLFGGEVQSASGTVVQFNDLWVFSPLVNQWTWVSGSSTANALGVYGALGQASAGNMPGARAGAVSWIDGHGNLWLFGGVCFNEQSSVLGNCDGSFNDLWEYTPSNPPGTAPGQWTWVSGSSTPSTVPNDGAVYGTLATAAANNTPGARNNAQAWIDSTGNLWLFGGSTLNATLTSGTTDLNDLWRFNPSSGLWTWMGGANTPGASSVYGAQGVAAASNVPGARDSGTAWTDEAGNFWLYGGELTTYNGATPSTAYYGDLWEYSTVSGDWVWMSGSITLDAAAVYGTVSTPAETNLPGGRAGAAGWIDGHGNPWLFGGNTVDSSNNLEFFNDLWEYYAGPVATAGGG